MKKLFLFLLLSVPVWAQHYNINVGGLGFSSGSSVPASCSPDGKFFFQLLTGWNQCIGGVYVAVPTSAGGSGTVTSIATTTPITGGTITTTGTIACATCVTSSSPGVGVAHFAGSTQAVTSSAVDLSGADATGTLAAGRFPALTGDATTSAGALATSLAAPFKKRECEIVWAGSGSAGALLSGDDTPAKNSCYNKLGVTETITAVYCKSDNASNTTTVNPTFGSAGTGTTILSGALTCGSSDAYSSTGTVSNGALTDGSGINPAMGGTLTGTNIHLLIVYTVPAS